MKLSTNYRPERLLKQVISSAHAHIDSTAYLLREASIDAGIAAGQLSSSLELLDQATSNDADDHSQEQITRQLLVHTQQQVNGTTDLLREASMDAGIAAAELSAAMKIVDGTPPFAAAQKTGT
ncbi:hypothetical protein RDV64_01500 [Acuticoccus sp. MNP-M23]|uniref:hypothetical protein n=1 Tax=Acuticoccus sp. MNP-M23 TaxID=3072793 RepID=UPI002814CBC6|nr:hypothetical protein [Acuticoccus sp. MNP-M23]WMS43107.1 hypothetical protein RDV64_01500 [Acuticoccus sp. MNP-M23]